MKKKISPHLKDMIVNMVLVQKFVGNISFAELVANKEKYLAVQRCIEHGVFLKSAAKNIYQ